MENKFYKVAIISDTHFKLFESAYEALKGNLVQDQIYESNILTNDVALKRSFENGRFDLAHKSPDQIIHCGDIGQQHIVDLLESISPLIAVNGNCDFQTYRTFNGETPDFTFADLDGVCAAITHIPEYFSRYLETGFFSRKKRKAIQKPDLLIHGHTHVPEVEFYDDGSIMLCPGSASQGRYGSCRSLAFLYISNKKPVAFELVKVLK